MQTDGTGEGEMWRGLRAEIGTSTALMVISAVFGAVMILGGLVVMLATGAVKFGLIWCVGWALFTAYDLYVATRGRNRRRGAAGVG